VTILVTQPNNDYASQQINVFANDKFVGSIGPGDSLMVKSESEPCTIKATCGFISASTVAHTDGEFQVRWSINIPMELVPAKSK